MRRALAVVALALALAGCGTKQDNHLLPVEPVHTAKPDPDLVRIKQDAGIPDCAPGSATSSKLPDLTLQCLGGGTPVDLSSLKGPMVIDLFASWCGPCKKELPVVAAFDTAHGSVVPVLGIDFQDRSAEDALKLAKDSHVDFPLLTDPEGTLNARAPLPRVPGLPIQLFIDASGDVAGVNFIPVTSEEELVKLSNQYLGTTL